MMGTRSVGRVILWLCLLVCMAMFVFANSAISDTGGPPAQAQYLVEPISPLAAPVALRQDQIPIELLTAQDRLATVDGKLVPEARGPYIVKTCWMAPRDIPLLC